VLKVAAIVLGLALAGILAFATTQPDEFQVQREIVINAAPESVFPLINDLRHWDEWSPLTAKDPAMNRTLSGANSGLGAVYEWDGNKDVGQGRMEIVDMSPASHVTIKLDFIKPFAASNTVDFALSQRGDNRTEVSWRMHGPVPYVSKLIGLFVDMDAVIGRDFETGLLRLKSLAEK
jgi:carbon monoxide dehydrogenase subunit G